MLIRYALLISIIFATNSSATIRICTQNLGNFGFEKTVKERTKKSAIQLKKQRLALTKNFIKAKCDIIAVQEVISKDPQEAVQVLKLLSTILHQQTKDPYDVASGKSNDQLSKQGYIFRSDLFRLDNVISYYGYLLEPLTRWEKNRRFSRGPLRLDLTQIKTSKKLTLFNFHFKSQAAYGSYDSSKFGFEYDRIQMAQGLYDIAINVQNRNPDRKIILLGDRNSANDSASAKILAGELDISHFQQRVCSLSKNNSASCKRELLDQPKYVSLIEQVTKKLVNKDRRSSKYKIIDDILVAKNNLDSMSELQLKQISARILPNNPEASDHSLLYVDLP